jgi:hypothetical protein
MKDVSFSDELLNWIKYRIFRTFKIAILCLPSVIAGLKITGGKYYELLGI